MDKRSIIFIVGMTLLFFLVNQWFHYDKRGDATTIDSTTAVEFIDDTPPKNLNEAEIKRLRVVRLYRDVELKEFFIFAIHQEDNFLTIASEDIDCPDQLYLRDPGEATKTITERIELRIRPKKEGDPILYSRYPLSKLPLPWIPDEGEYNVQMVYFDRNQVRTIKGTSYGVKHAVFDAMPTCNALLLLDIKGTVLPYGFFDRKTELIHYFNETPTFDSLALLTFPAKKVFKKDDRETHYILENEYFQLVFSNLNGALAEINLPFHSEKHPNSVVRKIEFDRILQENYPNNDYFPQHRASKVDADGKTIEIQPSLGGYYPLIRRDLIRGTGETTIKINPQYYTATIFERDIFPFVKEFRLTRFEKDLIEFQFNDEKRKITKTFSIPKDFPNTPYVLDLSINIEGDARKLVIGTGIPEVELISGSFNPTLKYRTRHSIKSKVEQIKTPKVLVDLPHVDADWCCTGNGFFGIIIDPLNRKAQGLAADPIAGKLAPTRLSIIDAPYHRYPSEKYPGYGIYTPVLARPGKSDYRLFLGPFDKGVLKIIDRTFTDPSTGYSPDYTSAQSYHGWFAFISQPFAKFLFTIMDFFHSITRSWGISIILLTIVLRLMLYPLNNWSMKSTAKMQKLSPRVKEIQEKYKKDQKRAQIETMNLYKREKVNPFGGCFPILIQLPFLFGMFDLLKSSFELRGAPFISGWIDNLTAPDVLFSWNYPIPFFGASLHLLPILLGVIMFFQQKIMSASQVATDQQKQQRSIGNIMTIVFTVMFYHFPSGLNLYWISSMLLGILQQWLVNKKINTRKG